MAKELKVEELSDEQLASIGQSTLDGVTYEAGEELVPTMTPVFPFEKEGDTLMGKLVERKSDVGDNNSNMYFFETNAGMVSVWGCNVLDSRLLTAPMDVVYKVTFLGKKESLKTKGRSYKDFKVVPMLPI